jgi:hypothetical protein
MTTATINSEPPGPQPVGARVSLNEIIWDAMAEARALDVCITDDRAYRVSFNIVLDQEALARVAAIGADQGRGVANVIKRKVKLGMRLFFRDEEK